MVISPQQIFDVSTDHQFVAFLLLGEQQLAVPIVDPMQLYH
jgi:hypothetical protein